MATRTSILWYLILTLTVVLIGGATGYVIFSVWDLPEVKSLEEFKPNITSRVYSDDTRLIAEFYLENRIPVDIADVPDMFVKALVATEDARFYRHHGLDLRGIMRAAYRNLRAGKVLEGGSSLTQQLSKVLFLTPERSFARKLREMTLALRIEQRYTKREILSLYLNQVYFGSGAYGVEAASQIYFGKPARTLTIAECALLAGLPRSPKYYSPFRDPKRALSRRAYVISRMAAAGVITRLQAEEANKVPVPVHRPSRARGIAPYFIEHVRQQVEERFGSGALYAGGLNISTSINYELQASAEQAVAAGIARIEARKKTSSASPLQAALIAIEPSTGRIRALVGGRDFNRSQFNRAFQALRQPGSAFKPVVFAAALEQGHTASDILDDAPITIRMDRNQEWMPENFTRTFQGPVTLRTALSQSLNVPTVRLFEQIGAEGVIRSARKIGITSPLAPYPALALGSSEVTLAELASAYAVFAANGVRIGPVSILAITDNSGRTLFSNDAVPSQVMQPETAYLMTSLLKGVVEHGTGWKARELGRPSAGKTGTTNDYRDAWFIGYTPALLAGVWVGYDDQRSIGPKETGAHAALPIWLEFMKKAHEGLAPEDFAAPGGILFKEVDEKTGLLAGETCMHTIREAFLAGTEPKRYCEDPSRTAKTPEILDEAPGGGEEIP